MKFFSNEAKENDPGYDRSDVATSDPVAVPQQRAGSPWNDTPGDSTPDFHEPQHRDSSTTDDDDHRPTDEPSDSITTDELADRDRTSSDSSDSDEPEVERLSEPITTTYGPDGTVTHSTSENGDDTLRSEDDTVDTVDTDDDTVKSEDETIKDEGTFDSPEAVEPATGEPISDEDRDDDQDRDVADHAVEDRDGDGEPDAVVEEPLTDEPAADDEPKSEINGAPVAVDPEPVPALDTEDDHNAEETPVVAAVPVGATPGSVPAAPLDRLFTDGDSFAERFRDIQLRFVDSPKEATAEAATLVGEAVDKLTAALTSQKDSLAGDSDDTEQLRVQLRGYRDLLNRLTGL
ncbi:hypothetical protein [Paractinoplanes toevensis]|uniref:Uncharacterized protein n=1 Tax=Paractinoplanes toevensis TaxID=571911 RepID=A0A919WBH0_9ACTN|nr:hypothetical protein [Actinoplanes toevensis]GIM97013.1 hypothetical protein Ato02nite_088060 [Actinoplanes toevensis]